MMRFLTHGKPDMGQNEFQGIPLPRDDSEPHLLVFHDTVESNIHLLQGHNRGDKHWRVSKDFTFLAQK